MCSILRINQKRLTRSRENGCVTYDSINKAFHAASQRMKYPLGVRSKARAMTDIDIDHFGHVMLETTRILAREYDFVITNYSQA